MSYLQYTAKSYHLQWNVRQLSQICHYFYKTYFPDSFKHRRNVGLGKVSDEALLVLLFPYHFANQFAIKELPILKD